MDLFKGMTLGQVEKLRQHFNTCVGQEGDAIFHAGEPATTLYLVLQGRISLRYQPYDDDGPPIQIAQAGPGQVCGWSAIVGRPTYSSDGICLSDTVLMCIQSDALRDFCVHEPEIGRALLENIAEQVSGRWQDARKKIDAIFSSWLQAAPQSEQTMSTQDQTDTRRERLIALLEKLDSYIAQYHGGSVTFVSLEGDTLKVKMSGACATCSLLPTTLHGWIEGTIQQFFPEITVEAVE